MNHWNSHTLFRLLIGFVAGIMLYTITGIALKGVWIVGLFLAVFLVGYRIFSVKYVWYTTRYITGIGICLLMTLFGYEHSRLFNQQNFTLHISNIYTGQEPVLVQISDPIESRPNSYKATAKIKGIEKDGQWITATGKLLLYFQKDSLVSMVEYGDRLLISATLNKIAAPVNPGEFDYQRFLANKNIYFQAFVRQNDWVRISRGSGNIIYKYAIDLRNVLVRSFEKNKITGQEFAVVNALVLGYDDYLDNETRKEFSAAGAMHVLCVSGLHVGIIFLVLNGLLFFLNRNRHTRLLKSLLLLAGIWSYAMITGLAPSVLRASAMLSFVIIGMAMKRPASIYNSLAASAFVLLLINPWLIHEVGFQLSYAAVLAIVSIQPLLYKLWVPKYWLPDQAWGLITVSIAAQLGTFPLGLYYFHQFPNYFILTNMLVIPLATIILYLGFMVAVLSPLPLVSYFFAQILVFFLKILNSSVSWIDQLPFSVTNGVFITISGTILLYLLVIFFFRAWMVQKVYYFHLALVTGIVLLVLGVFRELTLVNQQKVVVYSVRNDVAVDLMFGKTNLMLASQDRLSDASTFEFQVSGNRIRSGMKEIFCLPLDSLYFDPSLPVHPMPFQAVNPLFTFGNRTFMVVDETFPFKYLTGVLQVDVILVTSTIWKPPPNAFELINAKKVVLTNKIPLRAVELWEECCREAGIPYHTIRNQGAFVMDL